MSRSYRTVFISDLHLGMRGCQSGEAARFLEHLRCEKLYLVGDILDLWWLKRRWHWPECHGRIVRRIFELAEAGTEVIFVPGNHDEAVRQYAQHEFAGVKVRRWDVHHTVDGRRLLVTHGDEFVCPLAGPRWLSRWGGTAYRWLVHVNHHYNRLRRRLGLRYWSLSRFVKLRLRRASALIGRFEQALVAETKRRGFDGVVCGHIHKAEQRIEDGIAYFNCGDWLESCTALVEHACGRMQILEGAMLDEQVRSLRASHEAGSDVKLSDVRESVAS
ncbi:MAG: UDP-2,3-diacylglucosamine diphosphatase [Phycisphaeraceae bacterium]